MKVKELIVALLECEMDADVVVCLKRMCLAKFTKYITVSATTLAHLMWQ